MKKFSVLLALLVVSVALQGCKTRPVGKVEILREAPFNDGGIGDAGPAAE